MKLHAFIVAAASALVLAGCSTPAKVDSGAIHATTFSFINPGQRPAPNFADTTQRVHSTIQDAITKNLSSRGLSKVEAGGDVTVGYLLILGNNASTTSINDYFGYRDDLAGLQDKAHHAYTSSANPNYFEAGTLVIDVIDSKTFKLLKRGYATRPILHNPSEEARAARVQEVVEEILKDLRVRP